MNKNYHLTVLAYGIVLLVLGMMLHMVGNWVVRLVLLLCVGVALFYLWVSASYIIEQVERFFMAISNRDFMIRFPKTKDKELAEMYKKMNEMMQIYSSNLMDIETKRLYYDRILRVMTHELRNSITPVISLANDMLKRPDAYDEENLREGLTVISEECTGIKSFLDAYYDLTHLPKPNIKEIDATALFGKLGKLFSTTERVKIEFMCTEGLRIKADPDLLLQVLNNVIKNGVEALQRTADPHIIVRATDSVDSTTISVIDNGPGIPMEQRTVVFQPFYTTKDGGSGIGLCLSRQIIHMHKGEMSCTSSELGGAEFLIQLPR